MSDMDISEGELHAFIDGELDAARADAVAARIAADPALATRVAAFRSDMAMLKKVYGSIAGEPAPGQWRALTEKTQSRPAYSWRMVGTIAAVLVAALIAAPYAYRAVVPGVPGEIVTAALTIREETGTNTVDVAGSGRQYDDMVSTAISERVKVPDLGKMGYRLSAIRLYPRAPGGSAAELLYRDQENRLFTLYLRHSDGTARFDQFERAGLRVCVWQDDELGMVMAGNVTTAAMQRLASLAYTGLTL
jgi:anti-sigma factor RsiW